MTCLLRTCLVPDGPLMWLDCPDVWLAVLCDDEPDAARTAGLVHRTEYQAEADRFFSEAFAAATGPPLQGKMLSDVRLVRRLDEVASLLPLRALRGRHWLFVHEAPSASRRRGDGRAARRDGVLLVRVGRRLPRRRRVPVPSLRRARERLL